MLRRPDSDADHLLPHPHPPAVIDNYHNSFPTSIERVSALALADLPADASAEDKEACKVDVVRADLCDKASIQKVFEGYKGKDDIWGVVHVAAHKAVGESGEKPIQ